MMLEVKSEYKVNEVKKEIAGWSTADIIIVLHEMRSQRNSVKVDLLT